jgi:hypothetical protein
MSTVIVLEFCFFVYVEIKGSTYLLGLLEKPLYRVLVLVGELAPCREFEFGALAKLATEEVMWGVSHLQWDRIYHV